MWLASSQTHLSPKEEQKNSQEEAAPEEWLIRLVQMNEDGDGILNKEQYLPKAKRCEMPILEAAVCLA